MSHLILPLLVIVVLVTVIAVMGAAMKRRGKSEGEDVPVTLDFDGYERRKFLFTPAEYSFFRVLQLAVGTEYSIQVKVRLADLIDVRSGCARRQAKVNMVTRKHLDFVLCEPKTMAPVLGIELDDSSHDSAKSQKRDGFVNGLATAVGMPLVRVPAARGYEVREIKVMMEKALTTTPT